MLLVASDPTPAYYPFLWVSEGNLCVPTYQPYLLQDRESFFVADALHDLLDVHSTMFLDHDADTFVLGERKQPPLVVKKGSRGPIWQKHLHYLHVS